MATPVTSMTWEVLFRRDSLTDQSTYSLSINAITITESVVKDIVKRLEKKGYTDVTYALRIVLP